LALSSIFRRYPKILIEIGRWEHEGELMMTGFLGQLSFWNETVT